MPDGTIECGEILIRLRNLEARAELIEAKLERLLIQQVEERASDAATNKTLARIGGVVVMILTAVGWLTTGSGWSWLKKVVDP